jgi:hypothetical protein
LLILVTKPSYIWLSPSSIPEISGEPAAVCPEVANQRIILLNFVYRTLVFKNSSPGIALVLSGA